MHFTMITPFKCDRINHAKLEMNLKMKGMDENPDVDRLGLALSQFNLPLKRIRAVVIRFINTNMKVPFQN